MVRPRVSAKACENVAIMVQLNELFSDLTQLNASSFLMIEVQDRSLIDGKTHRADWYYPFESLDGEMDGRSGTYLL